MNVLASLDAAGHLQAAGAAREALDGFIEGPSAVMIYGRALYPRFYRSDQGELDRGYPYLTLQFPRLAFTTIGPRGTDSIVFPLDDPPYFPNAADVLVLGCYVSSTDPHIAHVDALAVFLLEEGDQITVYARQPAASLRCPASAIECTDNRECRTVP